MARTYDLNPGINANWSVLSTAAAVGALAVIVAGVIWMKVLWSITDRRGGIYADTILAELTVGRQLTEVE